MPIPRNFNLFRAMLNNSIDQHPLTHHYSDQEAYIMFLLTLAIAHQRQNQLLIQDGEQENHGTMVTTAFRWRTNSRTARPNRSSLESLAEQNMHTMVAGASRQRTNNSTARLNRSSLESLAAQNIK